jgi:hypothetical protein
MAGLRLQGRHYKPPFRYWNDSGIELLRATMNCRCCIAMILRIEPLCSGPVYPICQVYFGLESGGQSGRASIGLLPLCTVGAAEFEPPASGRTALFSIAMEFDVLSLPLPDVAAEEVVQLVSCFSLDGVVDWATAGPTSNEPTKIAAPMRLIILSLERIDRLRKS